MKRLLPLLPSRQVRAVGPRPRQNGALQFRRPPAAADTSDWSAGSGFWSALGQEASAEVSRLGCGIGRLGQSAYGPCGQVSSSRRAWGAVVARFGPNGYGTRSPSRGTIMVLSSGGGLRGVRSSPSLLVLLCGSIMVPSSGSRVRGVVYYGDVLLWSSLLGEGLGVSGAGLGCWCFCSYFWWFYDGSLLWEQSSGRGSMRRSWVVLLWFSYWGCGLFMVVPMPDSWWWCTCDPVVVLSSGRKVRGVRSSPWLLGGSPRRRLKLSNTAGN